MANGIHKLTAKQVEHLTEPGRHADGGGLYLKIAPTGARSWVFMWKKSGRRREMGLGSAAPGYVSLAQARQKAAQAREVIAAGGDPINVRDTAEKAAGARATTFGEFADKFVEDQRPQWSNDKHAAQWAMTLGDAYCKKIRRRPIAEIDTDDVLAVLRPVWNEKPETARRLRMRLERVLDAARVLGLRSGENPARWRGQLDHLLPKHGKITKRHHPAMPWQEVPAFMVELEDRVSVAAPALRFLILTAARTSEVILAKWDEIDEEAAIWTVPAERVKGRRVHRVPLSDAALEALDRIRGQHPEWVFPGKRRDKPLSNMAMEMQLRRMGHGHVTVHGFRSSFRDWVAEATTFQGEVAEMALAHVVASATEAAYRRGDLFDKRRALMNAWAEFCLPREASEKVVEMKAGAR